MEKPSYMCLVFLLLFLKLQAHATAISIAMPLALEELSEGHTPVGQNLILNCTLRYRGQFTMVWDVPNENEIQSSSKIHFGKLTKTENEDEYFQDLKIENTTIADQGQYTCTVKSGLDVRNVSKIIRIFDPTEHFINLTARNGVYNQLIEEGSRRVEWRINIDAHPIPKLIWYNNKDKEIETGRKYIVMESIKFKKALLTIKDITIFDRGYYKLKAINDFEEKTIQLFLNVTKIVDYAGSESKRFDEIEKQFIKENGPIKDYVAQRNKNIDEFRNTWQHPTNNFSFLENPASSDLITQKEVEKILQPKPVEPDQALQ